MAAEWELGMGMPPSAAAAAAAAPNYSSTANNPPTYLYGLPSADTLRIDDLLDFSNHDIFSSSSSAASAAAAANAHILQVPLQPDHHHHHHHHHYNSMNTSNRESVSSYNLSSFPDHLYIPSEEAAELEWLSKFVEDSFSDVPYPASTITTTNNSNNSYLPANAQAQVDPTSATPRQGARSKRSRASSFLANVVPSSLRYYHRSSSSSSTSSSSSSDFPHHTNSTTPTSSSSSRKKGGPSANTDGSNLGVEGGVRRCTHCASEKTPQWRTGPLGPKTLCNACGVRYKSGRLVQEYRPAASPTFVLTQHSNSHRKVMELRRQKEQLHLIGRHENPSSAASNAVAEMTFHDYEVC